jgi:hypothetical protein
VIREEPKNLRDKALTCFNLDPEIWVEEGRGISAPSDAKTRGKSAPSPDSERGISAPSSEGGKSAGRGKSAPSNRGKSAPSGDKSAPSKGADLPLVTDTKLKLVKKPKETLLKKHIKKLTKETEKTDLLPETPIAGSSLFHVRNSIRSLPASR